VNITDTSTTLIVSPPRHPADRSTIKKISSVLGELDSVREAHLPDVIEIGASTHARPMLFVVVEPFDKATTVSQKLKKVFGGRLRLSGRLEYRVIAGDHPLLQNIRETDSMVGWRD